MKIWICAALLLLAPRPFLAGAETRMQISGGSATVYARPSASAQPIGRAGAGEIVFVTRVEDDWAAISPPEHLSLWLNKDFIEGNRVIAKSIQVRSGPGIQFDVVGTLERGAPVMPRGEEGEWCQIAPPSSATLWVKKSDLSEVATRTTPIREVAPVAEPTPPPPQPEPRPVASPPPVVPPPAESPSPPTPVVEAAPPPAAGTAPAAPATAPAAKVAPSVPVAASPPPAPVAAPAAASPLPLAATAAPARPVAEPTATVKSAPAATASTAVPPPLAKPKPVTSKSPAQLAPPPQPAMARPTPPPAGTSTSRPARTATDIASGPAPIRRAPTAPAASHPVPTTAGTVAKQKSKDVGVQVNPAFVDELDLADMPGQGAPIQVEGELRNAPFMTATPSRYRLVDEGEAGFIEMICHIHGDPELLRQYVGQGVAIRGREYWVEDSDMPVVVVGQIVPLAPASEPVMY